MRSQARRRLIRCCAGSLVLGMAGCLRFRDGKPSPSVTLSPTVENTSSEWQLDVTIRSPDDSSLHDVTVVAFDVHGDEVCRTHVGDFLHHGRFRTTTTLLCDDFPAIVTALAEESPCDGAIIQLTYWVDRENGGPIRWDNTNRECDEELPPDRVLEKVADPPVRRTSSWS